MTEQPEESASEDATLPSPPPDGRHLWRDARAGDVVALNLVDEPNRWIAAFVVVWTAEILAFRLSDDSVLMAWNYDSEAAKIIDSRIVQEWRLTEGWLNSSPNVAPQTETSAREGALAQVATHIDSDVSEVTHHREYGFVTEDFVHVMNVEMPDEDGSTEFALRRVLERIREAEAIAKEIGLADNFGAMLAYREWETVRHGSSLMALDAADSLILEKIRAWDAGDDEGLKNVAAAFAEVQK